MFNVYQCVFVNCVWFLSSKNDVFTKRNPSVWDETYHSAGKQRYGVVIFLVVSILYILKQKSIQKNCKLIEQIPRRNICM